MFDQRKEEGWLYTEVRSSSTAQVLVHDVPHVFTHVLVFDPTHRPHPMLGDLEVLVPNCRSKRLRPMPDRRDWKTRASTSIIGNDVNGPTSGYLTC